jgi:hypothetical protein
MLLKTAPALMILALLTAASPVSAMPFGDDTAQYTVVFQATWSAATHPGAYPNGAHFSGLIGGTHDSSVAFWTPGQLASPGIESMAEVGSKTLLSQEINVAIGAGQAGTIITGGAIFSLPGTANAFFSIDLAHPEVTLVSMVAPSPDWFVGVTGLSLFENGDWVDSKVVSLLPWDAGTDSGVNFNSTNSNTNPAEPITALTGFPFAGAAPLGAFVFTRTDDPADLWTDLGLALPGTHGPPLLVADGSLCGGTTLDMTLTDALENTTAWMAVGLGRIDAPFFGGVFVPDVVSPAGFLKGFGTGATGTVELSTLWPVGLPAGVDLYVQFWVPDAGAPFGYAGSNAVTATTQ